MDMDRDENMTEIAPMPGDDPAHGVPEAGRDPAEDDAPGTCASASSGRPPRRRRAATPSRPKAMPKTRPGRGRPSKNQVERNKGKDVMKEDAKKKKLARSIEIAPWRTKIARQKWLVGHRQTRPRPPHGHHQAARSSSWRSTAEEETVIDCEGDGDEGRDAGQPMPEEDDGEYEDDEMNDNQMEEDDEVEVEIDEDGQEGDDGDGDGEGDEDEGLEREQEHDETNLMQKDGVYNGKQLGALDYNTLNKFVQVFKKKYSGMVSPTIEKPVKQAIARGLTSRLPGTRKVSKALMAQISALKMVEGGKSLPGWWRLFWKRVRNAVRRSGRVCHVIEDDDEVILMQYMQRIPAFAEYKTGDRFWLARMMQKQLELLQSMQKGIGAKLRQLMNVVHGMELRPGVRDLVEMIGAVAASFPEDESDEGAPDAVDEWVEDWSKRIRTWTDMETSKLESVIMVEDSVEVAIEDSAKKESAFVEMIVALQKRLLALATDEEACRLRRAAAVAQTWEDWALRQAMEDPDSPKRRRTVGTQVNQTMLANDVGIAPPQASRDAAGQSGCDKGRANGEAAPSAAMGSMEDGKPEEKELNESDHAGPSWTGAPLGPGEHADGTNCVEVDGHGTAHALQQDLLPSEAGCMHSNIVCPVSSTNDGGSGVAPTQYLEESFAGPAGP